jgi:hypothetical protein
MKTPPPPGWDDECNPGYNPKESFYESQKDKHSFVSRFIDLVSREEMFAGY